MGRVSQKCTSPGGEVFSKNGEASDGGLTNESRSSGDTTDLVSMAETYAIAASKADAVGPTGPWLL